jgi:quercetin dioxygenase-like cupin family protein
MPSNQPVVLGPGEGRTVAAPAGRLTFKATAATSAGTLTAFESCVGPGDGPPLHVHRDDEFILVLAGRLEVRLGEALHDAPAGTFVFIPKGVAHTWRNAGEGPARFFAGFSPAAPHMERFFERAGARADPFAELAGEAGMDVLGPRLGAPPAPARGA